MSKICHIWVRDEVYMTLVGLEPADLKSLWDKYGIEVEGSYWMPARRLGRWDGKLRFFDKDGKVFLRLLDEIAPFLEHWGYEIELHDERRPLTLVKGRLTSTWFKDSSRAQVPFELRPYQVQAVNKALDAGSGIVKAATGAGKTAMLAGLCDIFGQEGMRALTIVPSADLVGQTSNTFKLLGIEHGVYSGNEKNIYAPHVIATWQSLQNNPTVIADFQAVIVDECVHPDTLIKTSTGELPINTLNEGDLVLTVNESTNEQELKPILKIHRNLLISSPEKRLKIKLDNGKELIITGNHKVLTKTGWICADALTLDDELA